jgi:hypothetical protein
MTVQKKKLRSAVILGVIILLSACRKDVQVAVSDVDENPPEVAAASVQAIMKEIAEVLEKVYENDTALMEVNAAILSGYYHDERILIKDLLVPQTSDLYRWEQFLKLADTGAFSKIFRDVLSKGNYPVLRSELIDFLRSEKYERGKRVGNSSRVAEYVGVLSEINPIAIYFPYSENFLSINAPESDRRFSLTRKPTLVPSTHEGQSATGRSPFSCTSSPTMTCYRDVVVNDDYAYASPTHIITVGASRKTEAPLLVPPSEQTHRLYHGASRLTAQMDNLISFTGNGGGSEVKVCRVNGYLRRQDEQIDDFAGDVVTLHYTRGEIRKKQWKRAYTVWDPNWNYQDVEQIYAVYEEDTKGTRTIDGTLRTTLSIPGKAGKLEGDIGFKIQMSTQDEVITQRKIDRKSYFRDGLNSQGWGFLFDLYDFLPPARDWPIYDGGSIWQYTFPYRIY